MNDESRVRKFAWYYAATGRGPITESRGLFEGVAFAQGQVKARWMLADLKRTGRAPRCGVRLVACGIDGEPNFEETLVNQQALGAECWFEYVGRARDRFRVCEFGI